MPVVRGTRPYYKIDFKIGDLDLSMRLESLILLSWMPSVYPNVFIKFNIDEKDKALEKLHGQQPVKVDLTMMTEDKVPGEQNHLDLMVVDIKMPMSMKQSNHEPENQMSGSVTLACLIKEPFIAMSTAVNKVMHQLTPVSAVEQLLSKFAPNIQKEIEKDNENKEIIDQIVVPPMSLSHGIKYLDKHFGLFKGPYFAYCRTDENNEAKFYMWDLSKKLDKKIAYKVDFLTQTGKENQDRIGKAGEDDETFYTYSRINTVYKGNLSVMKDSFKHKYVVKPSNKFYEVKEVDAEEIFKNNAVSEGSKEFTFNEDIKKRMTVHTDHTGYESTEDFFRANLARKFSNLSMIEFKMDRNLPIKKISQIGVPIEIKPNVPELLDYQGKYIVSSSVISFTRNQSNNYICNCSIRCFRGNVANA